jgi:hypothetical protein
VLEQSWNSKQGGLDEAEKNSANPQPWFFPAAIMMIVNRRGRDVELQCTLWESIDFIVALLLRRRWQLAVITEIRG